MANTFLNTGRTVQATSNPVNNVNQVSNNPVNQAQAVQPVQGTNTQVSTQNQGQTNQNAINPITIPIQIQPQIASASPATATASTGNNNIQTLQTNQTNQNNQSQANTAPTPQAYNPSNTNSNVVDFNQIYNSYQSQYGNNNQTSSNATTSGIKKTSLGTTIVTPTTSNLNSVKGQYQSAYADTINGLISEILGRVETGFEYDPSKDTALQMATEYAANSTLQSLAGSGVLNSSATAERVARVVSNLIPQYEEKAHDRWIEYLGQLADTAQLVMNYDSQQFEYWKDAKDREFQEKQFEYQQKQDELENAWKRVDELGYVDNEAAAILGVKAGTLSGEARLAKEQQEFELRKMREQLEIQRANDEALYKLRAELDKDYANYTNQLDRANTEYEYQLASKYGKTSNSKSDYTSLSTYQDIIESRWVDTDDITGTSSFSIGKNNNELWNYIKGENQSGRMDSNTAYALIDKYNLTDPNSFSTWKQGNTIYAEKDGQYYSLTLTNNATKDQIISWGNTIGIDVSDFI